ncbi:hypothetical protein CspeluHIS016_0900800 [Cutaneotrichosporon spelunceum]|uniref:Non-structural maintenance of chromosomes element 1 homolog n=1 Tax=Cutaneotrichosporon spelunceum TaxID=1672016 RepID=A0AAD3TZQ3_9TREE|nr:hypothetical protein CspeluHIS016_0900800 [Cutaneotrichosporon spelunceum]
MVVPTDLHRVFNQSLLSRRAMTDDTLLEMYKRSVKAVSSTDPDFAPPFRADADGVTAFLGEVTTLLEPLGMLVKRGADEETGRRWTALVNAEGAGDVARLATDLTPLEIGFVRTLIAAIVESYPANSVGSRAAVGLVRDLPGPMTKSAAEALLKALVARGWLAVSERGRYSLAPRGMLELDAYLRGEYDDYVQACRRCNRLVMTGVACATCDAHYHGYCYGMVTQRHAPCLECKTPFADPPPTPLGEKAVGRAQDGFERVSKRRRSGREGDEEEEDSQAAGSMERRAVEEEEDEDELEEDEGRPHQPRRSQLQVETVIPDSFVDPDGDEDDEDGDENDGRLYHY